MERNLYHRLPIDFTGLTYYDIMLHREHYMKKEIRLISSSEAAQELGVHHKTVARLLRQGKLDGVNIANRWLIERNSLDSFKEGYVGKKGRPKGYSSKRRGK